MEHANTRASRGSTPSASEAKSLGFALELLTFVFGYPGFPPFYFITARPELDRLEGELAPEALAAAREAAQTADFDTVVAAAEQVLAGALPAA